ncbi:Arylsulfatase [Posidoniimonas corsicana]|uniref:Arylsulfatase n=2 Tax=Posidoniimonas corsicana TaxID=1938618 RepID=A0A5C5V9X9_9BACT|nr:Arylsulfatase [Posidoniimonas corsicana]
MSFTDAHSASSVCTPTRYGLLTGRYCWRTRLQTFVLYGYDSPLIVRDRLTVGTLLQEKGYTTACIGKWHLGMGLPKGDASPRITEGPTTRGFHEYFGISASLDMPPFAFIDGDELTEPLTTIKKWQREGAAAEGFEAVDVLPSLAERAVEFIHKQAGSNDPFFLYLPLSSPHTPIVPANQWRGASGVGGYGDFVVQTDAVVGQVVEALDRTGVADETLVIVTSDNGCSKAAGVPRLQSRGHYPSGALRGLKTDIFEGGHRVPFFVRWPGQVASGSRCDQLICLNDLLATLSDMLDAPLPPNAGEDSVSILSALRGDDVAPLREALVHHSINGSFAIRQGDWKLLLCQDSGGVSFPKPGSDDAAGLPMVQLYNLATDLAEEHNVQDEHPQVVQRMRSLLEQYVSRGRSTPGPNQDNDVEIKLVKPPKAKK